MGLLQSQMAGLFARLSPEELDRMATISGNPNVGPQRQPLAQRQPAMQQQSAMSGMVRSPMDNAPMLKGEPHKDVTGQWANIANAPLLTPEQADLSGLRVEGLDRQIANARGPAFFDRGGLGSKIARTLGNVALNYSASRGDPFAMATIQNRMQMQRQQASQTREDALRLQDRQWEKEDNDAKMNVPQFFMSGRDRVKFDPSNGSAAVVYDGPEDYQTYADTLGMDPNSEEYRVAVQDYVLRSNGPTAYGFDVGMERERQGNRVALEGVRANNRALLKATPSYTQANPRPPMRGGGGGTGRAPTLAGAIAPIIAKVRDGKALTPGEQQAWQMYRPGNRSGVVTVTTPDEARRLPSGTRFRTPDGRVKVRP